MSQIFAIGCEVQRSTNQSINSGADTLVTFPTTIRDDVNFVTSTSRFTAPMGGWYVMMASVRWASAAGGERTVWFKKNGNFTNGPVGQSQSAVTTAFAQSNNLTYVTYLVKGDFIEVDAFQSQGGALNVTGATFSMVRLPGATANAF